MSLSLSADPGESLSLTTDPGEFHTNWEESLWSGICPDISSNGGLGDNLLGSWTSMEEQDWSQDNPILLHDPFTMHQLLVMYFENYSRYQPCNIRNIELLKTKASFYF